MCPGYYGAKERTTIPCGRTEHGNKEKVGIKSFRATQSLAMRDKRKGDEKGKVFKESEQKLGVGENVEADTFREL